MQHLSNQGIALRRTGLHIMHSESLPIVSILLLVLAPAVVSFLLWVLHDLWTQSKRPKEHRKQR